MREIEDRLEIISALYYQEGDRWMGKLKNIYEWLLNYNKGEQ